MTLILSHTVSYYFLPTRFPLSQPLSVSLKLYIIWKHNVYFPLKLFLSSSFWHPLSLSVSFTSLTRIHRLSHTISFHCYHIFCLPPDFFSLTSTLIFTLFLSFFLSLYLIYFFLLLFLSFSPSHIQDSLSYLLYLSLSHKPYFKLCYYSLSLLFTLILSLTYNLPVLLSFFHLRITLLPT